ncbi:MAG: response regulator [Burkholderiales bacterium]|nr:response regulator [Burkholderiales bacterium]
MRIIAVDDEENILHALKRSLKGSGWDFETCSSAHAALSRAKEGVAYDVVVADYRMPEMDGVSFLEEFRKIQPDAERIILSGYADFGALTDAINRVEIFRFIPKPWDDLEFARALQQAADRRHLLMENRRLADLVRVQQGKLSRQEMELRRLEEESPGITRVKWGPDGSVLLEDFD